MARNFAAEIRNVGIRYIAHGGIVIVGNFAKILGDWILENQLWDENDVMYEVLENVPVYGYSDKDHGLSGCFAYS